MRIYYLEFKEGLMTNRLNFSFRIFLLLAGVVLLAETQAQEYNILKRFQYLEDKYRTQEMLRPYDNDDFVFDLSALLNTDATDFIDEAEEVADYEGSDQLDRAQEFLRKYDKTEQNLRVQVGLNIPFFDFSVYGIKFKPSLRATGNLGFLMGIQASNLTVQQAVEYLGSDVPQNLKDALLTCVNDSIRGENIITFLIDTPSCGLTEQEKQVARQYEDENYIFPEDTSVPDIYNYVKAEARAGLYFDYIYDEHFFGAFNIYALGRADYRVRVSADSLANDGDVADLPDEMNTTINAAIDYTLGYRNGNLTAYAGIEDLKLTTISDNEEEGGELIYGNDPLLRLHGEYLYKYSLFSVKPFVGIHKRASYGISEGYYAGADLGAHVWSDRIGLRLRGMVDKEHFTFSPMAKLWLMHIEYMLKTPMSSEVDGLKPATIHSLNIRISI